MLDQGVMAWLRRDANVQVTVQAVTTAFTLVQPADPDRFAMIFRTDGTVGGIWGLGLNLPLNQFLYIPPGLNSVILTEDQVGQLITFPVYAAGNGAGFSAVLTTCSYTAERRRIYNELIRKYLSQYGAL